MTARVSEERWDAALGLMLGRPATPKLVAKAMGIDESTVTRKAAREGWALPDFRRKAARDRNKRPQDLSIEPTLSGPAIASGRLPLAGPLSMGEPPGGLTAAEPDAGPDANDMPELSLDEQVARLGRVLSRQIDRLLTAADAGGGLLTKAQTDMLSVIMRLAEKFGALASESAAEKQTRSDDELADILRRVDARIVELARGLADRMVARRSDA